MWGHGEEPAPLCTHLEVAAVHGVVQRRAARAVGDIDSAEQGDDGLHTLGGPVGSGDVQRRLPILVAGIDVCRVLQEEVKCFLAGAEERRAPTQPAGATGSSHPSTAVNCSRMGVLAREKRI